VFRNKWVIGAIVIVVLVAAGGYAYAQKDSGGSSKKKDLIILNDVQRRTLEDSVTLQGTLARKELRTVTSVSQSRVSAVYAKDGSRGRTGAKLFALDGRDAIAEPGSVRFFRPLDVGDRGDDVLQLKKILSESGDNPGPMTTVFTEQTRFALAQWQAEHHYPGATPVTPTSVTVSLTQSTAYTLGAQTSAGLIIGPAGGAHTTAATSGEQPAATRATLTAFRADDPVVPLATPVLSIQSTNAVVPEGQPATFVITASEAQSGNLVVNLNQGGTATSNDVVSAPATVTLPMGDTSVQVSVPTRVDNVVKPTKTLTLSVAGSADYSVGSPSSASTSITNTNVPAVHLAGGGTVAAGGSAKLTVIADQAPLHNLQVSLQFAGDAQPGTDYRSANPVLTIPAGQKSASVTVQTISSTEIEPSRHIVASITPAPTSYGVGSPGAAVITIPGQTGDDTLPIATLTSATTFVTKGGSGAAGVGGGASYPVTISLTKAVTTPLTIVLAYGGNAQLGTDFTLPGGSIVIPPGQTSLTVQVPLVTNNVVESDRVLEVALASGAGYRVGSPNSASVTIKSEVVPELTISSNTASVAAGGAATFTITADQAPVKDTSVNYQAVGTAQPGQDFEPLVGTALLPAGKTSVTVVLRSIEKDVSFLPTDMIVAKWPTRIGQVFVKEGDAAPPGTPILSLTDPNFTVTLQASASDRTKLKVGQHCTVELVGGTNEEPGTISELDDNITSLEASTPGGTAQQVYEGKIAVGDLGAADGAAVTIKVVDQQEVNALTVPIAAVKQNGSGQDVVRVIDIADKGKITEMPVQTGLSEGSYIEIKKGLKGNETVIVEVDQPA
jgi:hypothetical protein